MTPTAQYKEFNIKGKNGNNLFNPKSSCNTDSYTNNGINPNT